VCQPEEIAMRRSALALVAAVAALDVLSGASAAWAFYDCEDYYYRRCRGFVIPCSLDGVNPAYHPLIFGNPKIAREEYGFIRSRDGAWHVEKSCVRGPYHGG
jgi:hypothetical protein